MEARMTGEPTVLPKVAVLVPLGGLHAWRWRVPSTETDQEGQGISRVKSTGFFYALNLISAQVQLYWPSYPTTYITHHLVTTFVFFFNNI